MFYILNIGDNRNMRNEGNIKEFFKHKKIEIVILVYLLVLLFTGLLMQPFEQLISGLYKILTDPGLLITDYMVVGGIGPAFVNAATVGLIGYLILIINKVSFRGMAIASIFLMSGFAFMGKNILSIIPIIIGVYVYSKITGREFVVSIYPALFGTALAPIVTQGYFGFGWGLFESIIIGVLVGVVLPPLASHVLIFHEGYNLYNVGFASGIIGLIFFSILKGMGYESKSVLIWGTEFDGFLRPYLIILFISMIILGIILGKHRLKDYLKILKHPGIMVTDFTVIAGFGNSLINMGLVGLIGVLYITLVGGNFNGATICGILTMVGFAAFGKHPLNITPILIGVWLGTLFSNYEANQPGPLLSALFGTALAPIAGQFGPIVGIIAGILQLNVASNVGVVHGALNLYNNGFSAGFVAAFLVSIMKSIKKDS